MNGTESETHQEVPQWLREKMRRDRELQVCGQYFANLSKGQTPTENELASRNACAYSDFTDHGIIPAPSQALRLPQLVPQPKAWVAQVIRSADDGKG